MNEMFSTLLKYEQQLQQFACCGFDVVTGMTVKITIFWDVSARSLIEMYRHFGATYRFYLQGRRAGALSKQ
jgi:hypothetical protein